jgi:hypothetical protein
MYSRRSDLQPLPFCLFAILAVSVSWPTRGLAQIDPDHNDDDSEWLASGAYRYAFSDTVWIIGDVRMPVAAPENTYALLRLQLAVR